MLLIPTLCILAQTTVVSQATRAPIDTLLPRKDSIAARRDSTSTARIAIDLGGGLGASFIARSVELTINSIQPVAKTASPTTAVQLRFLRTPDTLSPRLASHVGGAERLASVEATLSGRSGASPLVLRLRDVQVVTMRLVTNDDDIALMQQRLGLEESIAQLSIDLQEAQRQLTVTESLDKRKMSSSLEVAHAHATADILTRRLAVQREHLALVEQQLARWIPIEEEVVLSASGVEMQTR
jgi:hypothetical protein